MKSSVNQTVLWVSVIGRTKYVCEAHNVCEAHGSQI